MALSHIGRHLEAARNRRGWSREALAYHAGLSNAAIAQIETGRRRDIRLSTLASLAAALELSIDRLIGAESLCPATLVHRALIYGSDEQFVAGAVPFLSEGVQRSECPLAVTTTAQIELLRDALGDHAHGVEFVDSSVWYSTPIGALRRYRDVIDRRLAAGAAWVRILGEPVWPGRSDAQIERWIRYESLINATWASWPATVLCPYDIRSTPADVIDAAQRTHPELAESTGPVASRAYREPEDLLLAGEHGRGGVA